MELVIFIVAVTIALFMMVRRSGLRRGNHSGIAPPAAGQHRIPVTPATAVAAVIPVGVAAVATSGLHLDAARGNTAA